MTIPAALKVLNTYSAELRAVGHANLLAEIRDLHRTPSQEGIDRLTRLLDGHSLDRMREPGLASAVLAVCAQVIAEARTALLFAAL